MESASWRDFVRDSSCRIEVTGLKYMTVMGKLMGSMVSLGVFLNTFSGSVFITVGCDPTRFLPEEVVLDFMMVEVGGATGESKMVGLV